MSRDLAVIATPPQAEERPVLELVAGMLETATAATPRDAATMIDASIRLLRSVHADLVEAPAARAARKGRKAGKPRAQRKARSRREDPPAETPAPAAISAEGIIVNESEGEQSISFNGKTTELLPASARLAAALVKAAGQPIGRAHLVKKVWGASAPASAETMLGALVGQLREACAGLGLEVKTIRGVGVSIAPAE